MGDVLTLVEKAQHAFDEKKALELEQKMRKGKLTLTDFYEQMQQMKDMGSMQDILSMLPGGSKGLSQLKVDDRQLARTEAIILSMTEKERTSPEIINSSRKKRIAAGCGLKIEDVNRLLKQFEQMQRLMKQLSGGNMKKLSKMGFNLPM